MATNIPPWLPPAIGGLDIGLTCWSLFSMYLTFYWKGWRYVKGDIKKTSVAVAVAEMIVLLSNLVGTVFSSVNLIREPQRDTLALRLILSLVLFPVNLTNWNNALEVCLRGPSRRRQTTAEVPAQPLVPPSTQDEDVAAAQGETRDPTTAAPAKKTATLGFIIVITPTLLVIAVGITAFTATVLSLAQTNTGFHVAAIIMWVWPLVFMLFESCCWKCIRSSRRDRRRAVSSSNPKHKVIHRNQWAAGTILSSLLYICFFAARWDRRQEYITDETEAWIQFAEALFGVGG